MTTGRRSRHPCGFCRGHAAVVSALSLLLVTAGNAAPAGSACTAGELRQVTVGCRTGRIGYPPRTEICAPSPRTADWYVQSADLGTRELAGTGAQITLYALPASGFDAQRAAAAIRRAIASALAKGETSHAQRLETLLQEVRQKSIPLQGADAVAAEITLRPYQVPHQGWEAAFTCDANPTAGSCPQATVPPLPVTLVCLPQ